MGEEEKSEQMEFFKAFIKHKKRNIFRFALMCCIFLCVFALYRLPIGAVLYPAGLCALCGVCFWGLDYKRAKEKHEKLTTLQKLSAALIQEFPVAESIEEEDYRKLLHMLCDEQAMLVNKMNLSYTDMIEYYTIWAHQIKTPIASMRLHLQNEDTDMSRQLSEDLQRIEQYVEMVLAFLRLDSESTDYVFKEHNLDVIIRGAVKKFSTTFIRKRLRLLYEPIELSVITDEKWLSFVVEQVLSNALKYTKEGSISITLEMPGKLCIKDTGIGIATEDLPRIFENGYTGYNGRNDKKASGIGLYLCKRVCDKLGHGIAVASKPDEGTVVTIDLAQKKLEVE